MGISAFLWIYDELFLLSWTDLFSPGFFFAWNHDLLWRWGHYIIPDIYSSLKHQKQCLFHFLISIIIFYYYSVKLICSDIRLQCYKRRDFPYRTILRTPGSKTNLIISVFEYSLNVTVFDWKVRIEVGR